MGKPRVLMRACPRHCQVPPLEDEVFFKWRFYFEDYDATKHDNTFHLEWQFGAALSRPPALPAPGCSSLVPGEAVLLPWHAALGARRAVQRDGTAPMGSTCVGSRIPCAEQVTLSTTSRRPLRAPHRTRPCTR